MIKNITIPSGNYIFVEVPVDAKDFEINHAHNATWVLYDYISKRGSNSISLSDNVIEYEIISTTNDITEEQCKDLIDKPEYGWYLTYTKGNSDSYHSQTAKESLKSLIQSLDLNTESNYILIKNKSLS